MKQYLITLLFLFTLFITNSESFSKEYTVWKCDWKEIQFDDKKFFEVESITEKSKNDIIFFSKRTKYDNLILSYTSDQGHTWERDSFLYTGNYTLNKKNQIYVYDRPLSRMNIINAWTMWKHKTRVDAPLFIGDAFFEINDSLLVAMPKYSAIAKTVNSYLINLKDSSTIPMGPIDSTGEIIEPFQHIRYVYKSNIPNRICFISDKSEFYYSDDFGKTVTQFYTDPLALIRFFPTKNGIFYYSQPGPTYTNYIYFNGHMIPIEAINFFIVRLKSENGEIDTVFRTYTTDKNIISSDNATLNNNGPYISLITNNDSLFFSNNYGDNFYYVEFPSYFDVKKVNSVNAGITQQGEVVLIWYDSTAGGQYHGAIGKPYPNPYSVATELIEDYKTYRQGDLQIIDFGNPDFLNSTRDIELYNIFGQKIENLNYQILKNQLNLSTAQLTSGVYMLILANDNKKVALKLLIAN